MAQTFETPPPPRGYMGKWLQGICQGPFLSPPAGRARAEQQLSREQLVLHHKEELDRVTQELGDEVRALRERQLMFGQSEVSGEERVSYLHSVAARLESLEHHCSLRERYAWGAGPGRARLGARGRAPAGGEKQTTLVPPVTAIWSLEKFSDINRAVFKKPPPFFCQGQPPRTAPKDHQPPTANRQPPPTANLMFSNKQKSNPGRTGYVVPWCLWCEYQDTTM